MKLLFALLGMFFISSVYAYECDGRQYCSEMKSCDEARWVARNCPDVRMDGDRDGNPCENWCGHNRIEAPNAAKSIFERKSHSFNYLATLKNESMSAEVIK
ncbi:excalibur calcium-binding domain-containing protein [Klebsiella sp. RHBSTW-00484]|uniref:excalibur calcium-binding domain-containing protein n=1 Tax=unclassified Klebsiella TaxID=2608929 RepID=UPI0015E4F622|nr:MULTISPECIES: excalibur calcium-binding domain-containing protein [unclassified Klebsiella]MBA7847032.1 excalibur calcium-binding domain-containing protein [Klebsiella sp. RHBSTW-00465]QLO37059.1 excalibur calcium-binding domain-containing protein [Klebsiella sp. RHBSTW-00484]QLT76577.1 excalibur calcium-binding domain-containing protein [Klebsiella sp. RHBSTW-00464]